MTNNKSNNKRIAKNTIFLYVRMIFVLIINLYTSRVVLRTLGVMDYGIYNVVAEFVGPQARYCEGLLDGIASLHPEKLKIDHGSKSSRKKVTVFDTEYFGTLDYWKEKASTIENEKLSKGLLTVIDQYYCNVENQLPPDSVG